AEVVTNDARGEAEQAPIVSELTAEAVHERDGSHPQAVNQTWHPNLRCAVERKRIEITLRDTRQDCVDTLQACNRLEIDPIVEHEHVAPLHQRNSHPSREKSVLRIKRAGWTGR